MKTIKLAASLSKYPLFTINDLARLLRKDEKYVKVVAYRLMKDGIIKQVERGKYTVYDDVIEFASCIAVPSYISFWTALKFYGLTEQLPEQVMIAIPKSKKNIIFNGTTISFTKLKQFWGYSKIRYGAFDIMIAEKEKAIIDCLLAKNTPFDEVAKAISSDELDYNKLIDYTKKAGNISAAKRIGYLIENYGKDASKLLEMLDLNCIPLNWSTRSAGKKNKRWKLTINWRPEL
ncbi:MAG: hypothetical protein HY513_05255 [Candidatus Aenigmarchaeota archaeon]|nr:hypothetical protein [Candidatus Aenigmarchaeota archaeon]